MNNVIDSKLDNNLCSGCGACSVICPKNCLEIKENEYGELRPVLTGDCIDCGRCLGVCPFENCSKTDNDFEECFIGVSTEYEKNGSSGGVARWFLNELLQRGIVDSVICVKEINNSDCLFDYVECTNSEELNLCRGSAYYPVSFGKIINSIKLNNKRIAIIGVPCFVTAIRNLMKSDSVLSEKIVCVAGLVCGHMPNKKMVDCFAWSQNKKRPDIDNCQFRIKDSKRPAWDYGIKLEFKDGSEYSSFGSDDFGYLFWRRLFSQECCNHCDDVFSDNADITFMDAWLPDYKELNSGTSMILCRNQAYSDILNDLNSCGWIENVDIGKAVEAQKSLCEYKANAGRHSDQSDLQQLIRKDCLLNNESPDIIDIIKREVYKNNLKHENPIKWFAIETKDRLFRK